MAVSDKLVGIIYWIATCKNICKIKETEWSGQLKSNRVALCYQLEILKDVIACDIFKSYKYNMAQYTYWMVKIYDWHDSRWLF